MNHELAKVLTTALVQFIDNERPEGVMCCSNIDCELIESLFELEDFPSIEQFVKGKLSRLTEFEKCMLDFAKARDEYEFDSTKVVELNNKVIELTKFYAKKLLALAKKELLKDDELAKRNLEGYIKGREDTMREVSDFLHTHFNTQSGTSTLKAEG